ncbi:hypothetical protein GCM10010992_13390 [Cloacibacterium rupense]|uniref:Response regulatory domain-containing protein n=1 Tax=Cloacibacterium rupense TaxID=517423 RepID=A0ABQ2NNT3_9FLAO|nr:response regulator transcription factor [Cloacibacterium rupense]GGP03763.1 hypothetical protein GCM10010992_13390 [Cloacibacterium rupense]
MFRKVLIAEDYETYNLGVIKTLEELKITQYDFVNYCDDALAKIKKSIFENDPYDLLITDLSFEEDYLEQNIKSGRHLILAAREIAPELRVVVFSIENKPKSIEDLFKIYNVNAFVSKGRNDAKELKKAITTVAEKGYYLPEEIRFSIKKNSIEFSDYDITLITMLSKGYRQQEIEEHFKKNDIKPYGLSSLEKKLNDMRESLNAKNNIELIVKCKDLGII